MVNEYEEVEVMEVEDDVALDEVLADSVREYELATERLGSLVNRVDSLKAGLIEEGFGQRDLVLLGRMLVDGVPKTAYEFMELEREVDSMWYGNTKRN